MPFSEESRTVIICYAFLNTSVRQVVENAAKKICSKSVLGGREGTLGFFQATATLL